MKVKKIIGFGVLALALIIVIALVVVWVNLNSIVRSVVQTQAQASLGVPVSLGGANVSLFGGSVGLEDLKLGSPQGFSAPEMLTASGIDVSANYSQLRSQPVHVKQLVISKPTVVIEQANGKINIDAVMQSGPKEGNAPPPSGEPMKVIIDDLQVKDSNVVLRPGIPGLDQAVTVPIPSVQLQNVGNAEGNQNGVAIKEVVLKVMQSLAQEAANSDKLPPEVRQLLKLDLNNLGQSLQSDVKSAVQGVQKNLGEQLQKAFEKPSKKKK